MVLALFAGEEHKLLRSIPEALSAETDLYLVGGALRNAVLKRPVHDFDFVLKQGARKTARRVANALGGAFLVLDDERDVARVILKEADGPRTFLDFSAFRAGSLEEDLRARDFSINAMAVDLKDPDRLIDPLGGLGDLHDKKLVMCSADSFRQDSLRTIRAVRMAVEFGLRMSALTITALKDAVPLLKNVSPERLRDELFKILERRQVVTALRLMDRFKILPVILPELKGIHGLEQSLPHEMDVWEHTLAVVGALEKLVDLLACDFDEEKGDNLTYGLAVLRLGRFRDQLRAHFENHLNPDRSRRGLLMLAGLFHDAGKDGTLTVGADGRRHFYTHEVSGRDITRERAMALALSNAEADYAAMVVKNHMRIHLLSKESGSVTHRAIYRYFRDTQEVGIDVCLLSLADMLSRRSGAPEFERWSRELAICEQLMDGYWNHAEVRVNPPRLVDGDDLMKTFGLRPGRVVGEILEAVREAQACGEIATPDEALDFAKHWLERIQSDAVERKG